MVFGASTVGRRSASGCRPLSVPSPPMAISPSMPSFVSRARNQVEFVLLVRVDVVARRADERAALGRIELGNLLEQRIQVDVRHARIEQAVEALDQPVDFNLELVGADDGAVDGGVQRRRVAAGRQDADAFHREILWVKSNGENVIGIRIPNYIRHAANWNPAAPFPPCEESKKSARGSDKPVSSTNFAACFGYNVRAIAYGAVPKW